MTEYALAANRKFTGSNGTPSAMLAAGELEAYRVRSNGTMRHLELYPLGSTAREAAEYVSDAIDMDGRSVANVARELHVSAPTVRRYLEGLELTEEVEAGDWDDLKFDSAGNPLWAQPADDQVEEILDQLAGMGKPADQVLAELEATKAAQAPTTRTRRTRTPRPVADVVASQGLPFPTDEERAAALADVTARLRAAGAPEPERTAEAALADPKTEAKVVRRVASDALVACFCNDLGAHRPGGLPSCKNPAPVARTRSHG